MAREDEVRFASGDLSLAGTLHLPDGLCAGDRRPAVLVLHGFGSNRTSGGCRAPCEMLAAMGYAALRFDMRGCGQSQGERGRVICLEQVEDTIAAHRFLAGLPQIDPGRIAVLGSSFGAAVAIYAAGVHAPIAAVVSSGGWGDGERKFRRQHATPQAWARFAAMLEAGRDHRQRTGRSLMVPRYDIVPMPQHLRGNVAPDSILEFPAETAQSMVDFRADDVVGKIAPRPLLLLHSSSDSVTPTEESIELFRRAGQPADLHLTAETDHFMFHEGNVRVRRILADWLKQFFPVG